MVAGLVSSMGLVLISPNLLGESTILPFTNPALISIPIGFVAGYPGTVLRSESREGDTPYEEIHVRSDVGSGVPQENDITSSL